MDNKQNREELMEILSRNTAWIENCDSKASTILGGIGVIVGILLATDYVKKFAEVCKHMTTNIGFWQVLYLLICVISLLMFVVGILFLVRVLISKVNPDEFKSKGINPNSLIHFSTIARYASFVEYQESLEKCTAEEMKADISSQIYICSMICTKKFQSYKIGLLLSLAGFALFTILAIIGVFVM